MILALYSVDSPFDRHHFDSYDDPKAIALELMQAECYFFDMSQHFQKSRMSSIDDFSELYNDEEFDGGWWSIVLDLTEDEFLKIYEEFHSTNDKDDDDDDLLKLYEGFHSTDDED